MTRHQSLRLYPVRGVGDPSTVMPRLFAHDAVLVPPSTTYSSALVPDAGCTNSAPAALGSDEYSTATEVFLPFSLPLQFPLTIEP